MFVGVSWMGADRAQAAESPRQIFNSLYGADVKRVTNTRGTADDVELAKTLLEAAGTAKGQAALVEVFCDNAYLIAARDSTAAGYDTAIQAMTMLAELVPDKAIEANDKIITTLRRRYMRSTGEEKAGRRKIPPAGH